MEIKSNLISKTKYGNMLLTKLGLISTNSLGIITTVLIVFFSGIFNCDLIFQSFYNNEKPGLYYCFLFGTIVFTISSIIFCLYVSFSDPGFISEGNLEEKDYDKLLPLAVYKEKNYLLKYCVTCKIVRDLRVFHCRNCNLCIMRHGK
jgi:hypothetical protein